MKNTIVTFGEVMGRLAPVGLQRFRQCLPGQMDLTFGGAEANVAASLAQLGAKARFVTALPIHAIADACVGVFNGLGVDTSKILRTKTGRLGLYFYENGANQRPSSVIYDRSHSAVSLTPAADYDWSGILDGACWLHLTGITPALSKTAAETVLHAASTAKQAGLKVSCDLNFRKKLWAWEPGTDSKKLAGRVMSEILHHVDILIANEEDAADVLDIHAENSDVESGRLDVSKYPEVAKRIVARFPNIENVAITLRESLSASHNNWGAMLFEAATGESHLAPVRDEKYHPYEIKNIVDRVGGGDSFGAGLIFALNTPELADPQNAIAFAVAASCLCHSIAGDINYTSRSEVEALMHGSGSGRVQR
jgi:2-dehydro-3-deoxygluconokinase